MGEEGDPFEMAPEDVDNVEDVVGKVLSLMLDLFKKSEMRLSPAPMDGKLLCDSSIINTLTIFSDNKVALLTTSALTLILVDAPATLSIISVFIGLLS